MPRGVVDLLHCWWSGGRPRSVVVWKIFFDKSEYYIKKRKGAQPLVHWEYTKGTRERGKKRKENLQS
jgi:hypothetical protein